MVSGAAGNGVWHTRLSRSVSGCVAGVVVNHSGVQRSGQRGRAATTLLFAVVTEALSQGRNQPVGADECEASG
ncbi:hypothetical protein OH686_22090 [Pseudomonas sp. SO81]|nr:hypothetical protein OH686_22090 [Pseudomonas sp. SO81]